MPEVPRTPSPRIRVTDAAFPSNPGVNVVWEAGLDRPIYVGVAARQSIAERWRGQHLRDRAGGSALRRSLGPHAGFVEKKLSVKRDGRYYPAEVEVKITASSEGSRSSSTSARAGARLRRSRIS